MYSESRKNTIKVLIWMILTAILAAYAIGSTKGQVLPPSIVIGNLLTAFTIIFGGIFLLINWYQDEIWEFFSWVIAGLLPYGAVITILLYLAGLGVFNKLGGV